MNTTCTNQKNHKLETNIEALTDSVHVYQLKNGELMYEKQGFILEKAELEKYLDISKKEVKDLEKKLGSALATIAKLEGQVKIDTLVMKDSVVIKPDSTIDIFFDYNDRWLTLDGTTNYCPRDNFAITTMNCIRMQVPLKVGTSKDDKWFVTSENPYVQFTSIEGANIDKSKPKRHSIGVNVGLGLGAGFGVCIPPSGGTVNSGIILGPVLYVGVGYTYKLIEF